MRYTGRILVLVLCALTLFYLQVRASRAIISGDMVAYPTLVRTYKRHEPIVMMDLEVVEVKKNNLLSPPLTVEELVGKKAGQLILPGTPLDERLLYDPIDKKAEGHYLVAVSFDTVETVCWQVGIGDVVDLIFKPSDRYRRTERYEKLRIVDEKEEGHRKRYLIFEGPEETITSIIYNRSHGTFEVLTR